MFSWFKPKKGKPCSAEKRILIIDDEATTLKVVEHTLKNAGYTVLTASCGGEGLKMALDNNPDIIVTDVLMPDMDGFMLLKELKKEETTKNKPLLVLSARQNIGDTLRRSGADAFLTKPVEPQALLAEIKRLAG